MRRTVDTSRTSTCDCPGNDLHHHANHPSQHDHHCPIDVRIFTKHDNDDRYKSRQCSEKRAYGAEEFCGIDLAIGAAFWRPTIWWMKSQGRSIDSQVKPNCATNHHHDYKTLGREHCDAVT